MPPLAGVAVKETAVPAQIWFSDSVIDMLTGSNGFTIIVTAFEVSGFPVAQVAFEVRMQVTTSLFTDTYV